MYLFVLHIYRLVVYKWILRSYSQYQEDLVVGRLLKDQPIFYLDIGAYDPVKFNNTYRFYRQGHRGINVEPSPINFHKFQKLRPQDTNLNLGVGPDNSCETFYIIDPGVNSTFSKSEADKSLSQGSELIDIANIDQITLQTLLKKYTKQQTPNFLSIDTEGLEMEILTSNDWKKFRPRVICIETFRDPKISSYLQGVNYVKYYSNQLNSIFVDNEAKP